MIAFAYEICGAATVEGCDTTMSELIFLIAKRPNGSVNVDELPRFDLQTESKDYIDLLTALRVAWESSSNSENKSVRGMIAKRVKDEIAKSVNWKSSELTTLEAWYKLIRESYPNEATSIEGIIESVKR